MERTAGEPGTYTATVLRSYIDDLGISVTELDAEMEWDCWDEEEDDYTEEE